MKVLNLQCAQGHGFEGWFASEADFAAQHAGRLVCCPLCGDAHTTRLPSAPRLNLSGARPAPADADRAPAVPPPAAPLAALQAQWLQRVQEVLDNTEDVGARFAEEARRIHYGETAQRGIRGQADADERAALADEGIEVFTLALPASRKGTAH